LPSDSLSDSLGSDRIEIDLINLKGPEFRHVESRLINLHLIRAWQTRAVMFDAEGNSVIPAEMLHRRADSTRVERLGASAPGHRHQADSGTQAVRSALTGAAFLPRPRRAVRGVPWQASCPSVAIPVAASTSAVGYDPPAGRGAVPDARRRNPCRRSAILAA